VRLDKYLKISRLIKRRTVAKDVCDGGRVSINGRTAKPGSEVRPGDIIVLDLGHKTMRVEVLETPESATADRARGTYRILEERKADISSSDEHRNN